MKIWKRGYRGRGEDGEGAGEDMEGRMGVGVKMGGRGGYGA